jgi:beta-lactamase regulating signal transducer with metallopeptidase domain
VQIDVILRILLLIVLLLLPMVLTFWAIRDVARRSFSSLKAKVIWFAVVTLLPVLGALVYLIAGRPRQGSDATSAS